MVCSSTRPSRDAHSWRHRTRLLSQAPRQLPPSTREFVVRAADFAGSALHAVSTLDSEIAKAGVQAPDRHALTEIALYAIRNIRCAANMAGAGHSQHTDELIRDAAAAEASMRKGDLPAAVRFIMADSPQGLRHRATIRSLGRAAAEYALPLPVPHRAFAPAAPLPPSTVDMKAMMSAACVRPSVGGDKVGRGIPALGFGTGIFYSTPAAVHEAIVRAATVLRYAHFDCAQGYHNEPAVGAALAEASRTGVPRDDLFIATKLSEPACMRSPQAVIRAFETSLASLRVGYVDLYYIHADFFSHDLGVEAERVVWGTLERLVESGRVRALGVCNYGVAALERLWAHARLKPSVLQCKFDPLHPGYQQLAVGGEGEDVVGWAHAHGMAVVGYSTLSGWPFSLRAVDDPHVHAIARACGYSSAAVLLRHAIQRGLAVIPSSSDPARLQSNRDALSFSLDEVQMLKLDGLAHLLCPVPGAPAFVPDAYGALLEPRLPSSPNRTLKAKRPCAIPKPTPSPFAACRPYPEHFVAGAVERRRYDDPELRSLLTSGVPVVITGGPLVRDLVGRWSFATLAEAAGAFNGHTVHVAPWSTSKFNYFGKGDGPPPRGMSVRQFTALAAEAEAEAESISPPEWRYYMHAAMAWPGKNARRVYEFGPKEGSDGRQPPANGHRSVHDGRKIGGVLGGRASGLNLNYPPLGGALLDDFSQRVDWEWLASTSDAANEEAVDGCSLWLGHGRGCTPLHFDGESGFLCQVHGRKRVLLFSPSQSYNLYPFPVGHDKDTYAQVDVENPDLSRFPAAAQAHGLETILEPGDVLWMPSMVWHYVRQMEPGAENISLSFGTRGKDAGRGALERSKMPPSFEDVLASAAASAQRPPPASADDALLCADEASGLRCLLAGRWIEHQAALEFGSSARAGAVLTALAAGADATQTSDVIGKINSPSHLAATKLRFELVGLLGVEAANAVLRVSTRGGRLVKGDL